MSTCTLTCPRCGFAKDLERSCIPRIGTKVTCPKCGSVFSYGEPSAEAVLVPNFGSAIKAPPPANPEGRGAASTIIICNICFAENRLGDATSGICYNCGNIVPQQPAIGRGNKSLSGNRSKGCNPGYSGIERMAVIYMWLCCAPYVVAFFGFLAVNKAVGEDKVVFILYAYAIAGILFLDLVGGIPLLLIKYRREIKVKVMTTYLLTVVLPMICFIIFYINR